MKRHVCATSYCVEVTKEQLLTIMHKDDELALNLGASHTLYYKLGKIAGVYNVDYDGHFGPFIFFTVRKEHDTTELHDMIDEMIKSYCE